MKSLSQLGPKLWGPYKWSNCKVTFWKLLLSLVLSLLSLAAKSHFKKLLLSLGLYINLITFNRSKWGPKVEPICKNWSYIRNLRPWKPPKPILCIGNFWQMLDISMGTNCGHQGCLTPVAKVSKLTRKEKIPVRKWLVCSYI